MTHSSDTLQSSYILAVETSCDETSVSVVKDGREVLANLISSQVETHKAFGGVVPEVASRKHVEVITLMIEEAIAASGSEAAGSISHCSHSGTRSCRGTARWYCCREDTGDGTRQAAHCNPSYCGAYLCQSLDRGAAVSSYVIGGVRRTYGAGSYGSGREI